MSIQNINENESSSNENANRYLEFSLGQENYGVLLLSVKEVIPVPETTPLPNGPTYFIGIMNLRGQIISVVDLRKKLKVKPKEEGLEEAVVIVDLQGISIGLVVDSINKVLNIKMDEITEVPEVQTQVNAAYIQGVFRGDDRLTILLDMEHILSISEIKKVHDQAA